MNKQLRKLMADYISDLITKEDQTPQYAVFCTIHDILLDIWSVCHNDILPGDVSDSLYDRLHDEACAWADTCLKEIKHE